MQMSQKEALLVLQPDSHPAQNKRFMFLIVFNTLSQASEELKPSKFTAEGQN